MPSPARPRYRPGRWAASDGVVTEAGVEPAPPRRLRTQRSAYAIFRHSAMEPGTGVEPATCSRTPGPKPGASPLGYPGRVPGATRLIGCYPTFARGRSSTRSGRGRRGQEHGSQRRPLASPATHITRRSMAPPLGCYALGSASLGRGSALLVINSGGASAGGPLAWWRWWRNRDSNPACFGASEASAHAVPPGGGGAEYCPRRSRLMRP